MHVSESIEQAKRTNKVLKLRDVVDLLSHQFKLFPIPYEQTVYGEKQLKRIPLTGRIYETQFYFKEGKIIPYEELHKRVDFRGTMYESNIVIIEVWNDYGDDGHIKFQLQGYAVLTDKSPDYNDLLDGTFFNKGGQYV